MQAVRSLFVAILAFVVLAAPAVALADGRVALVVGNSTYADIGRLPNPDPRSASGTGDGVGLENLSTCWTTS